jgi:hypothetical protein
MGHDWLVEHATLFLNAVTTTARPLGNSDPKGTNMAVQSENERNKAVVDEYFKAGVQGHRSISGGLPSARR